MRKRIRWQGVWIAAAALLVAAPVARAQDGFLFRGPVAQVTVRGGYALPTGRGDLFDFLTSELTLDRRDFGATAMAAEYAILVTPRLSVAAGLGRSATETRSEFRDWVGSDGLPIEQVTRLRAVPATLTARYFLRPIGRGIGRFAWVPARTSPYLGAGLGATWYRLRQRGEFVDFVDNSIFRGDLTTGGWGATAQALTGVDLWLTPRAALNLEARYVRGSASPGQDFGTFDRLDLGGFNAAAGFSFRW